MDLLDQLHAAVGPTLGNIGKRRFRAALRGLEPALQAAPRHRTQLTLRGLRFRGEKSGQFLFHPGVNIVRAGNDKGKSSLLKLIQLCLTGKNELKRDVDGWIEQVELVFELDGKAHAVQLDKAKRIHGRLLQLADPEGEGPSVDQTLLEFHNQSDMQRRLEKFFNQAFGLRPLRGTQKDSRKSSDALHESVTSYRAYFRGLSVPQDQGYVDLVTDGAGYGSLFTKVVGMLLGLRGLDAYFAVDAERALLEHELAKEQRTHQRAEEVLGAPDLKELSEEIERLQGYVNELKEKRTTQRLRATSTDLDKRLAEITTTLLEADDERHQTALKLQATELATARTSAEIERLTGKRERGQLVEDVDNCPACETPVSERSRFPEPEAERCGLCHEDLPEDHQKALEQRLAEAHQELEASQQKDARLRRQLATIEGRARQLTQRKGQLQAQLRAAHQGTEEIEREVELESRYLGRLEAQLEAASQLASGGQEGKKRQEQEVRKQVLDAVLGHLRERDAAINERLKQGFSNRIEAFCTKIGFPGLEAVDLDAQLKPRVRQNGEEYSFDELSAGEKVRFVLAFYLALALITAEEPEAGGHPGLVLIDSPGKEEMVERDFAAVVELLQHIEQDHARAVQVIVATSIPAIAGATAPGKQIFIDDDDRPLFS